MDYSFSTPPISPKVNQSERVHLASPIQNFQHHQQLAYLLRGLEAEVVLTKNEQAEVATEWVAVKAVVAELRVSWGQEMFQCFERLKGCISHYYVHG